MVTGTPIENSVLDLWALLDIAWPGFFSFSGNEFLRRYGNDDPLAREELKRRLIEPSALSDGTLIPPIMLRRFKQDILDGLPSRSVESIEEPMPPQQQAAYDAVLWEIQKKSTKALEALQHLRSVSLHPNLGQPLETDVQREGFIAASARFKVLFRILHHIYERREKVLIFIELRDAQRALYELIRLRYGLLSPRPETINGATPTAVRDRIRQAFQSRLGFDVLILGPKAAGFGLTLTAANHVVHLNRW
jgi:SNF2 family DNA or RNA helicase